jgi:diacylglycerol kinase family enzyme
MIEVIQDSNFRVFAPHPIEIQADGEIFQTDGDIEISTLPQALKIIVNPDFRPWMH